MKVAHIRSIFLGLLLATCSAQAQNVLQLHPQNPHYFQYQGKPLIIIGSGEHYGAVMNLDFDYKTYLNTLGKDGLNHTRLFTGAYLEKQGDFGIKKNTMAPAEGRAILPWKRSNQPGYALGGNKFDLDQWDPAYFARLKDFMALASTNKVMVEVCLFSAHYGGGWNYAAFNPSNNINGTPELEAKDVNTLNNKGLLAHQEAYVRKLVRELNGFGNFYFEIQNEPWADNTEIIFTRNDYGDSPWTDKIQVVSQASNDWQKKVASWIKDEESKLTNKHLTSQNISNFYYPITEPDPQIDIFNFHYAYPRAASENYYLNKVLGFNETGFAGGEDDTYRRQVWQFVMAGGALFSHLDYSFSVGQENGQDTTYESPGGGSPDLRKQFGILKNFMEAHDLVNLKPDASVVKAAPGATTLAMSNGNGLWVVYWESLAVKSYDITLTLPAGSYSTEWMDVTTGNIISKGAVNDNKVAVPGLADMVLVVRRK
ncbi:MULTISPECIES: hypothetical protein [unclassified Imperialibacter]|uniref:hypothetical protein n=1 Tax=unclassified Imperialibacter TaxID=2629706 RepID=UPI001252239D|nr:MULTISPECIES: hypothetical protein [unclassified Imperialibacter]CAD5264288.1 conserved exported hypothetical protein [Imperialibacter sp. 89]CAD5280370.1 conserved exported hypothetical protein [Imperialibacter sp. 75]VVT31679.1 conserved exported hypothetical protein [Imperialibacter sp. EC-SDR9]